MRVVFSLQQGMKDDVLRKELVGRISGETAQEVQTMLGKDQHEATVKAPRLEVIKVDMVRELALIRRNQVSRDEFNAITIMPRYYLTGINDEGAYFSNELSGSEWRKQVAQDSPSLERLHMWMNRADQAFTRRIQGDILAQPVPLTPQTMQRVSDNQIEFNFQLVNTTVRFDKYIRPTPTLTLGNHRVTAKDIFTTSFVDGGSMILCLGEQVVIEHPQHGRVVEKLESGTGLLLVGQRGRNTWASNTGTGGFD